MARSMRAAVPNVNDELYTPPILVEMLDYYFTCEFVGNFREEHGRTPIVWCPFDEEHSEYVQFFQKYDIPCTYSHIRTGQDFFTYGPDKWDIVVSNPPFSRKLDIMKRLNGFGKPWVLLMNMMSINYMEIGNYFADNPVQFLIPDKRCSFDGNPSSFCSGYVCKDFLLDRDVVFHHLPHCNSGKNFTPARTYERI